MSSGSSVLERRSRRTAVRRWAQRMPFHQHQTALALAFVLLMEAVICAAIVAWPDEVPRGVLAPVLVFAALFIPARRLWIVYAPVAAMVLIVFPLLATNVISTALTGLGLVVIMMMMLVVAQSRARLGITGLSGENFLVDLRARLSTAARVPELPAPWRGEIAVHPAHGEAFSGDFLIAQTTRSGWGLEVALVDVSGKGKAAGSRSLALSGALSGLLGSVPAEEFLSAANNFMLRQNWEEGFATAIHVNIDLRNGDYTIGSAGHPAAAIFRAGAGQWAFDGSRPGPLLGVMAHLDFPRSSGNLKAGDALLLYSDGVIESRGYDLREGMDRMLGSATRAMLSGGHDLADQVVRSSRAGLADDRAAFALRRG